jgi:glutamate-1-semialdehyde 2,1-aminomutase
MSVPPAEVGRVLPGASLGMFRLPEDLAFVAGSGRGATLTSTDGREYVDYVLGSGPMVLGHAHPRVVEAIAEQAARGTTYYALNEPAIRLAERIIELIPCAESVKYCSTGSEATFYALRIARAFTGREKILKFEGAYHGANDYAVHGMTAAEDAGPVRAADSRGVPAALAESVLVSTYNDLDTTRRLALDAGDDLAAILVEPVQRSIEPVPGFLAGLRALCDELGAVLIFDEIVTGFRISLRGAQDLFGVTPDLCTLGKALGGGLALAAVAGRRDMMSLTAPGDEPPAAFISGTLSGNPLAAAAGLATLEVLEEEDGCAAIAAAGETLRAGLVEAAERLSVPLRLIGPPSFAQPVFGEGRITDARSLLRTDRDQARRFALELVRHGVLVPPAGKLYVSTAHTPAIVEQTVERATEALRVVATGGNA